ncbi:LysR family transcriptional regulator [Amycolatopsis sp. 195334CR]|uniref:LysR family transcriptional regulator n=1 Tax=Amycolatopsis sp. 195334CR TaxID=2814588 RepID=UPI001A8E7C25|nr:LysR family transcriptional regulator [Amycolatopsis sp. 195334CR]MBN6037040.1 LysR family transcriptional regulator [Amycolatopsis sp. 195334CR]
MELREIEIFLVLAEELHFGHTAERLRVSQARVSQSIRKAERQIGAPLFERTSRRVALTPIGERLRNDLRPAYRRIEEGLARAKAAGRGVTGELCLGFEAPGVAELISSTLDIFRSENPGCVVRIREADFANPFALLRDGEVDALITLLPADEPDITTGPSVHSEQMVLAVSSRHPLAAKEFVTLEDLARDTVLRAAHPPAPYWQDDPWLTPDGHPVHRGEPVRTFQELLSAVATGTGICPLAAHAADYFARPSLRFIPFRHAPPVHWGLVWLTSGETSRIRALAAACA